MTQTETPSSARLAEVAFYYPGWIWDRPEVIKSALLFFDGVALLVPEWMRHRPSAAEPETVEPLMELGLLHVLEPETFIDEEAAGRLAEVIANLVETGLETRLSRGDPFVDLSYSRLGGTIAPELADDIVKRLEERGLAGPGETSLTVRLHPLVHSLVLTLLAQILRTNGRSLGLDLLPTTDRLKVVQALEAVLNLPAMPTTGRIVHSDMQAVGIDLESVALDDVLAFRRANGNLFTAYRRSVQDLARQQGLDDPAEADRRGEERRQLITDAIREMDAVIPKDWKALTRIGLGLTGAWWRLQADDSVGAAIALGLAIAGSRFDRPRQHDASAFAYLFAARRQLI